MLLGTVVNALAVVIGGTLGLLLKRGIKEGMRDTLNSALALSVMFVGIQGAMGSMLKPEANPVLYIASLAVGGVAGELLRVEHRLQQLGDWLQIKLNARDGFSKGFVAGSLLFCVGTMSVLGALESGTQGSHSILFAKSLIDGIIAVVMASAVGIGVLFSGGTIFVYQSLLTLLAVWVKPYMTGDMLREISIIGGIIITAIGLNMMQLTKIKVGNLIPALLGPPIYYTVISLL